MLALLVFQNIVQNRTLTKFCASSILTADFINLAHVSTLCRLFLGLSEWWRALCCFRSLFYTDEFRSPIWHILVTVVTRNRLEWRAIAIMTSSRHWHWRIRHWRMTRFSNDEILVTKYYKYESKTEERLVSDGLLRRVTKWVGLVNDWSLVSKSDRMLLVRYQNEYRLICVVITCLERCPIQ